MNTSLNFAIALSVEHNCITHVEVRGDLYAAMGSMISHSLADDYDYCETNTGLDVWGYDEDGYAFRVQLEQI